VTSFRIDLANLCLWRSSPAAADERVDLTPKTFDVLRYLVEHPGRLVTHDELLAALWPGVHVQPEVLKSHILGIRNALGDKISSHRYIETQRGLGYRFGGALLPFQIEVLDILLNQKQASVLEARMPRARTAPPRLTSPRRSCRRSHAYRGCMACRP